MPAGKDKIIAFDPPGAIGLTDDAPIVLVRFNEPTSSFRPADEAGNLLDLDQVTGLANASVSAGAVGLARHFNAGSTDGFVAQDRVAGSTLMTRDMTVQAIAKWVSADQVAYGTPARMITRGLGFTSSAAETTSFGLNFSFQDAASVNLPSGQGRIFFEWQQVGGGGVSDAGAIFVSPLGFTMFTATRRWVSPTSVLCRYYLGDVLLGESTSVLGNIGGSTTGTTQIGSAWQGVNQFGRTFTGDIDELMILDREICREEIEATWLRITQYQPLGVQLFTELHDPGFPLPRDPTADAVLENRLVGNGLGYAAAHAENMRVNMVPQRSYGQVLEDWEEAVRTTPQPNSDIDTRRSRVLAKVRQRRGSSIPGIGDAIAGLLGGADSSQLHFLAYSNTVTDQFTALDPLRWDVTPAATWTAVSGTARSSPVAGDYQFTGALQNWRYAQTTVTGLGTSAQFIAKVVMTTPQSGLEAGIFVAHRSTRDFLLIGLRDTAGVFSVRTESFQGGVSQGVVTQTTLAGNPTFIYLSLSQFSPGQWIPWWSDTSSVNFHVGDGGFITHPAPTHWAGMYVRSIGGATAGAAQVNVDEWTAYMPFGHRPTNAYVMLDSALGFSPDVDGATDVLRTIRHAFVYTAFITSPNVKCGTTPAVGVGPMGGLL